MKPKLFAVAALLLLTGCDDVPTGGTPHVSQSAGRLEIIEDNGYTAILKDSKTGCEFVYAYVHDGLALIPGTCTDASKCK